MLKETISWYPILDAKRMCWRTISYLRWLFLYFLRGNSLIIASFLHFQSIVPICMNTKVLLFTFYMAEIFGHFSWLARSSTAVFMIKGKFHRTLTYLLDVNARNYNICWMLLWLYLCKIKYFEVFILIVLLFLQLHFNR